MSPQAEQAFSALEQLTDAERNHMLVGFIIAEHPEVVTDAVWQIIGSRSRGKMRPASTAACTTGEAL